MIDPDADLPNNGSWPDVKTPGSHAPVRHWVVGNLDAKALKTGDVSSGTQVSAFHGPSPPYGSHRYGQFLFKQRYGMVKFPDFGNESIVQWDFESFLKKYALEELVASNWHITEHAPPRAALSEIDAAYKSVLQVTCPKSCSTCQCTGCKNITVPLGKCSPAGQGAGVIGKCSANGKTFIKEIFLNEKCQGQSATRSVINTGACIQASETKKYIAFFCMPQAFSQEMAL
jgi:hypothetical protein